MECATRDTVSKQAVTLAPLAAGLAHKAACPDQIRQSDRSDSVLLQLQLRPLIAGCSHHTVSAAELAMCLDCNIPLFRHTTSQWWYLCLCMDPWRPGATR